MTGYPNQQLQGFPQGSQLPQSQGYSTSGQGQQQNYVPSAQTSSTKEQSRTDEQPQYASPDEHKPGLYLLFSLSVCKINDKTVPVFYQ